MASRGSSWRIHDHRDPDEADRCSDEIEAIRLESIDHSTPRQRPGHEDAAVRSQDPPEVRIGLQRCDEPVRSERHDAGTDPRDTAMFTHALPDQPRAADLGNCGDSEQHDRSKNRHRLTIGVRSQLGRRYRPSTRRDRCAQLLRSVAAGRRARMAPRYSDPVTDPVAAIESSFAQLPEPMRHALKCALDAARAGSLAIGAVVSDNGRAIARGRNRLHETDAGDDPIAGTSLAHAEINALAKLRFRAHEDDDLELHTTLQPCLQCLGAIRLAPVRRVIVLAPDPLWIGVEKIRDATPFVASNWPRIRTLESSQWSVLALLSPTRHALSHPRLAALWRDALPTTSALARAVDLSVLGSGTVASRVADVWNDLTGCVDEVERLAELARRHQQDRNDDHSPATRQLDS